MSSVDTNQKPETMKLAILGIVLLVCAGAFGVHKFNQAQAAKAKAEAINAVIAKDPVYQMIIADHPRAKGLIDYYLGKGYDEKGAAGVAAPDTQDALMLALFPLYVTDYNWYVKPDALYNMLSYNYLLLQALAKNPKGKAQCANLLDFKAQYAGLAAVVDEKMMHEYATSVRYLFLSARDKQLPRYWPGAPGYAQAVQTVSVHLAGKMMQLDPDGVRKLALEVGQKTPKISCSDLLEITYSTLQLPREEMALAWGAGIERVRAELESVRDKRRLN